MSPEQDKTELAEYFAGLLDAFSRSHSGEGKLKGIAEKAIIDTKALTPYEAFMISFLIERMQKANFGNKHKLEDISIYVMKEPSKTYNRDS